MILFLSIGLLVPTMAHGEACSNQAVAAITSFIHFDLDGYRLSSKGHDEIWSLTKNNHEPPAWPIFLIKSYHIVSNTKSGRNSCIFKVKYETYEASISENDEGLGRSRLPKVQFERYYVSCKDKCLIDLSFDKFKAPPHVSKESTISWLRAFRDIQNTDSDRHSTNDILNWVLELK